MWRSYDAYSSSRNGERRLSSPTATPAVAVSAITTTVSIQAGPCVEGRTTIKAVVRVCAEAVRLPPASAAVGTANPANLFGGDALVHWQTLQRSRFQPSNASKQNRENWSHTTRPWQLSEMLLKPQVWSLLTVTSLAYEFARRKRAIEIKS